MGSVVLFADERLAVALPPPFRARLDFDRIVRDRSEHSRHQSVSRQLEIAPFQTYVGEVTGEAWQAVSARVYISAYSTNTWTDR